MLRDGMILEVEGADILAPVPRFDSPHHQLPATIHHLQPALIIHLHNSYTVNKLQSLNLHFSSMFCIESKIVHVGAETIITLY
jgi:hypothetical protein